MDKSKPAILPDKFRVNIDTVKFSVDNVGVPFKDVTKSIITNDDGEIFTIKTNRKPLAGMNGRHKLQMRHAGKGNESNGELTVEGSPYGNRYGQNVYSSPNLRNACLWALRRIGKFHDLRATPENLDAWKAGQIRLHRVDLAVNFKLESEAQVIRVLSQLRFLLAARRVECHLYRTYVSLAPRSGKSYKISAYAKGAQMRSSLKKKDQGSDKSLMKLAQECEPLLRVELRLMGSELRRLNLDQVWAWSASTAREVFRKYFARLPLADITFGQLKPEDFKGMDMRMRAAFAHHKLGTDLSAIYCKRTRERHLAYFRKRGFNLNVPNQPKAQLMLTDILSKPGVIAHAPKWLADAGMAPRAKSRNRGDPGNHSPRIVDCS